MAEKKKEYSSADPIAVMEAEQKAKNERDQELADIKEIINRPEGLRFFRRLMAEGKVFQTTFTGNSRGMFLEGHRNLALKFLDDIAEAAPNKIADLMVKEVDEKREAE